MTLQVAQAFTLSVPEDLTINLDKYLNSPELAIWSQQLLMRRLDFTAALCFNYVSAIGAIRALHDAGLKVPSDVSTLGFNDVQVASYIDPSLSTIQQSLQQMGAFGRQLLAEKTHSTKAIQNNQSRF